MYVARTVIPKQLPQSLELSRQRRLTRLAIRINTAELAAFDISVSSCIEPISGEQLLIIMKSLIVLAILAFAFVAAAFGEATEDLSEVEIERLRREAEPAKPNRPVYIPPPRPPHPRLRREAEPEADPASNRPVYVPPPRPPHPRLRREAEPAKPNRPVYIPPPRPPHPRLRREAEPEADPASNRPVYVPPPRPPHPRLRREAEPEPVNGPPYYPPHRPPVPVRIY
ncbi:apidaecin 1 [Xylocopa sonorina]|uniref:apidaecin 1 n=1 Tax=Xylocopa sonorina TaxID=1818115 RepID=UPI00403AA618